MPEWGIMPPYGTSREACLIYGHLDDAEAREDLLGWDGRLMPADHPLRLRAGHARWVPDATGEYRQGLHWADGPGRGSFPLHPGGTAAAERKVGA